MKITLGSYYSGGVDAFAWATKKLDIEVKWHIENDSRCYKYLKHHYPGSRIYRSDESISGIDPVHIIAGGDPCQPHSSSGNKLGETDYRYRWPYMLAGIKRLQPDWVVNENVIGSVTNLVVFKKIADLEALGYTCQAFDIPAAGVGAFHNRRRLFIIANAKKQGRGKLLCIDPAHCFTHAVPDYALDACGNAFLQFEERVGEPALFAFPDGVPDKIFRLGAAGNSIVAPIPLILLEGIKYLYDNDLC